MNPFTILALLQGSQDDGLTLAEIVSDIPHDLPAMVMYVLIVVAVGSVLWFGRPGASGKPGTQG